jgi:ankyrin repeat protein
VTAGYVVRDGRTALALAALAGHSPVVALLIDAGADLNVKSNEG